MKLVRFSYKKGIYWGVLKNDMIQVLADKPFQKITRTDLMYPLRCIKLLYPTLPTAKIILAGLNYKDHAKELGMKIPKEPVIFLKPSTTLLSPNELIKYPNGVDRLDYEAELAVVIKKKAHCIAQEDVHKYILGYTCLNDVTARDIQTQDGQWTRAKSFDTFCPLGPCIETKLDPSNIQIKSLLNGEVMQQSSTQNFIFTIPYLISFISSVMTLYPGDIISTGTPPGVGPMNKRDLIEVMIDGIGTLTSQVM